MPELITAQKEIFATVKFSERELRWLKDVLKNPIRFLEDDPTKEASLEFEFRNSVYQVLAQALK